MGYLPGIRDPLSGAYMVRESDAHAWAEVYFADQGWVPVDSAPRPDITLLFNTDAGVGYLFGGGFGEEAYQTVKATPSKIAALLSQGLDVRGLAGILSVGSLISKCSDLRGSEQPAAFQEGIETSSPPGAKEGCQGHLAVGALP